MYFWNKNLEIAIKEKARSRLENNPTNPYRISYNRTATEVRKLTNSPKIEKCRKTCNDLDLNREGTGHSSTISVVRIGRPTLNL